MRNLAIRPFVLRVALATWVALGTTRAMSGEIVPVRPDSNEATRAAAEVIVRGIWGAEPGQFGKVDEASRPGPMDFAVTDAGLYVLDPVNARVQLFGWDGRFVRAIPIGTRTADFLAVDERGRVAVLDAFVRRELRVFDPTGAPVGRVALPQSIGLASAVWLQGERVLIEERHAAVHELNVGADQRGAPAVVARSWTGRPCRGRGGTVQAIREGPQAVVVRTAGKGATSGPVTLQFPRAVSAIVGLESDERGRIYVATTSPSAAARGAGKTDIVLVVLGPDGRCTATLSLPDAYVTDHYRKLGVSRAGDIIQMQTTEDEVRFVRWTQPAPGAEGGRP